MRQLRPGPRCPRFPDRGAKGREEGAQGVATEEALGNGRFGVDVETNGIGVYVHYGQSPFPTRLLLGSMRPGRYLHHAPKSTRDMPLTG
jgi:hypothetical protein